MESDPGQSFISFEKIEVIVKTPGKSVFYLQFHSLCLTSKSNCFIIDGLRAGKASQIKWPEMTGFVPPSVYRAVTRGTFVGVSCTRFMVWKLGLLISVLS